MHIIGINPGDPLSRVSRISQFQEDSDDDSKVLARFPYSINDRNKETIMYRMNKDLCRWILDFKVQAKEAVYLGISRIDGSSLIKLRGSVYKLITDRHNDTVDLKHMDGLSIGSADASLDDGTFLDFKTTATDINESFCKAKESDYIVGIKKKVKENKLLLLV